MNIKEFESMKVGTLLRVTKIENGYWKGTYSAYFNGLTKKGRVRLISRGDKKSAVLPERVEFVAKRHMNSLGKIVLIPA